MKQNAYFITLKFVLLGALCSCIFVTAHAASESHANEVVQIAFELEQRVKIGDIRTGDFRYAEAMLNKYYFVKFDYPEVYGQLNHAAKMTMGLEAYSSGDVDLSAKLLISSCDMSGFVLASFGPRMELAKKLFLKNQKHAVQTFLEHCTKVWPRREAFIWIEQIKEGKIPDFFYSRQ